MSGTSQTSDREIVELLRQRGSLCVLELAEATAVTSTAIRQRLSRLMKQGVVGRETRRSGRGRPSHCYALTEKGHRQSGNNFGDLALALWQEIRSISEPAVRRGLIARMAKRMAGLYADRIQGETVSDRMQAVAEVFGQRDVPLAIETAGPAPAASKSAGATPPEKQSAVLTVWACPYPELAEVDRGICAMERLMFADLIAQDVRLTACRLDGDPCCRFQTAPLETVPLETVPLETVPLTVSMPAASG
jgi:predicted ArsR family transcriptional regulator